MQLLVCSVSKSKHRTITTFEFSALGIILGLLEG